mgnify:CR=1 FL=1
MLLNGLNWENNEFFDSFFNFSPREQKKCSFSKTFLDTERLFGTSETERKERRVVESGARAVESGAKAGVPFRDGRSGGRKSPKKSGENE